MLIAATNHDKLLDSAVWRRFEYKLRIELPDTNAIIEMIDLFTRKGHNLSDKEKFELATALSGLSGANVEEILVKAMRKAIIHERVVEKKDYYDEIFSFKGIIPQNCNCEKTLLSIKANYLRSCSEKVFSYQVIANILNISKTSVSKIVKEASDV